MLAIFESKGKSGAKQIKEHLHSAWPVPDSRSQLEKLKKELKDEMAKSLEVVRIERERERVNRMSVHLWTQKKLNKMIRINIGSSAQLHKFRG